MTQELATFPIIAGLVGGLAFFLYGLDLMTDGLKVVAGGSLRSVLARMTQTRVIGTLRRIPGEGRPRPTGALR